MRARDGAGQGETLIGCVFFSFLSRFSFHVSCELPEKRSHADTTVRCTRLETARRVERQQTLRVALALTRGKREDNHSVRRCRNRCTGQRIHCFVSSFDDALRQTSQRPDKILNNRIFQVIFARESGLRKHFHSVTTSFLSHKPPMAVPRTYPVAQRAKKRETGGKKKLLAHRHSQ